MLGQPMSMLIPQVLGFRLHGALPEGATATDLVLTVTEMLRAARRRRASSSSSTAPALAGAADRRPRDDRQHVAGVRLDLRDLPDRRRDARATCASRGAPSEQIALVEAYAQGAGAVARRALRGADLHATRSSSTSATVEPSLAGPKRPQDRVPLSDAQTASGERSTTTCPATASRPTPATRPSPSASRRPIRPPTAAPADGPPTRPAPGPHRDASRTTRTARPVTLDGRVRARPRRRRDRRDHELHEHLEPVGDGRRRAARAQRRRARAARASRGSRPRSRPGSKVVTEYLDRAGLTEPLEQLGFNLVGYGCTTCIGNSGPAAGARSRAAVDEGDLAVVVGAVGQPQLRGAHQPRREDELPRLAAARASPTRSPARWTSTSSATRSARTRRQRRLPARHLAVRAGDRRDDRRGGAARTCSASSYAEVFAGDERWNALDGARAASASPGTQDSTYVRLPPYFDGHAGRARAACATSTGARVLALLGDSVTTDHISPGRRRSSATARPGSYLQEHGVAAARLQLLRRAPRQPRGDDARHVRQHPPAQPARRAPAGAAPRGRLHATTSPTRERADADLRRRDALQRGGRRRWSCSAGKEYGSGSSRDWAAKGTRLLGVRAVIAESFERIHRSNLVGMGVLPLQFRRRRERRLARADRRGDASRSTGIAEAMADGGAPPRSVRVRAERDGGEPQFDARVRIDTPREAEYFRHGGILQYVLRELLAHEPALAENGGPRKRAPSPAAVPAVLLELLRARGPSGYEDAPARVWETRPRSSRGLDRPRRDAARAGRTRGGCGARGGASRRRAVARAARTAARRLLVMGHIDEIGLIVTHIDDDGYLWFREVGGWDPQILVGQRVVLDTRCGPGARASSARSRSTCCARRSARRSPRSATCTSTSAPATATRRARWCGSATSRVIDAEPVELPNGRLASRALDNRLGSFVALEAARLVAEAGGGAVGARGGRRRPGGDHLRRLAHERVRARARRRDRGRRHPRDRRARHRDQGGGQARARLGAGDQPRLDAERARCSSCCTTLPPRPRRSRSRSRPRRARPAPTRTRCTSAAAASPRRSSRSRSATCTRRSSWCSSKTCTRARADRRRRAAADGHDQPLGVSAYALAPDSSVSGSIL